MRLILKLIAAPFVVLLTVLVAVLLFLISYPVGGVIYLVIAFLLSPYGLQAVAGAVITELL